jgi:hypothetical protein
MAVTELSPRELRELGIEILPGGRERGTPKLAEADRKLALAALDFETASERLRDARREYESVLTEMEHS